MPAAPSHRKSLGAFYTSEGVAAALVRWGLRRPRRAVLDPSCGDGRFLAPAAAAGVSRVVGCDIDPDALRAARAKLGAHGCELMLRDFFEVEPADLPGFDLVVGNPPFIRYQHFRGQTRKRALQTALRAGVRLTGLTSSWAPFLLHALQFVSPGGDLAMVVPAEILQTQYGMPTLRAVASSFDAVTLLLPEANFFPDALQACALLLAQERGGCCKAVRLLSMPAVGALDTLLASGLGGGVMIAPEPRARFAEALLAPDQREAWRQACESPEVVELGSLGVVSNGYVSGDNEFFHRSRQQARRAGLPDTWLRPAARSSRSLQGLHFTLDDVAAHERQGQAHHLVVPPRDGAALQELRQEGEQRGTPLRYKCRVREPWWIVPGLAQADVLVGYMSGAHPRAATNEARALYTNSLHGLSLRPGLDPAWVAFAMHSSLALLSLEIEGRSYGGGILKLEPTEVRHARVAIAPVQARLLDEVDALLRADRYEQAVSAVDRALLVDALGWPQDRVASLNAAWRRLRSRRLGRTAVPRPLRKAGAPLVRSKAG